MNAITRLAAAAALVTASTPAFAGASLSANQDGARLTIECKSSCALYIAPVGSRIHVFDITGTSNDERVAEGHWYGSDFTPDSYRVDTSKLPTRTYSYSRSEIDTIEVLGSNSNDYVSILNPGQDLEFDMGDGEDLLMVDGMPFDGSMGDDWDVFVAEDAPYGRVYAGKGIDQVLAYGGYFEVHGGSDDDFIETDDGDDTIYGNDGDDTIYSFGGDDTIYGGSNQDYVHAGDGDDVVYGEDGKDIIHCEAGNDYVSGGKGSDVLNGGDGDDIIDGNRGKDQIEDLDGVNDVAGGKDNDWIKVTSAGSTVSGSGGTDECKAADGVTLSYCESTF